MGTFKRQWRTIIVVSLLALCGSLFVQQLTGLSYGAKPFSWQSLAAAYSSGSISGTVIDSTNQPVTGITVEVFRNTSNPRVGSAVTASDGTYTLSNLTVGTYWISFTDPNGKYVIQYYNEASTWANASPVTVIAGQTRAGINAKLSTMATRGSITGTVTNTDDQPIANVQVNAWSDPWLPGGYASAVTSANGTYTLTNLPEGTYKVMFTYWGSGGTYYWQYYTRVSSWDSASLVTVTGGQTTSSINGQLRTTPAPAKVGVEGITTQVDPNNGQVTMWPWSGIGTTTTFTYNATCASGTPQDVVLKVGNRGFPMAVTSGSTYRVPVENTILRQMPRGTQVSVDVTCPGNTTTLIVGVILVDPSGKIYDSKTKLPISGATVTLYKSTLTPTDSAPVGATQCPTKNALAAGTGWFSGTLTPATPDQNQLADPKVNPFMPITNTLLSGADGYYRWDVSPGCWYVKVEAKGYTTKVSPVVGVIPDADITNLDFYLERHTYYPNLPLIAR